MRFNARTRSLSICIGPAIRAAAIPACAFITRQVCRTVFNTESAGKIRILFRENTDRIFISWRPRGTTPSGSARLGEALYHKHAKACVPRAGYERSSLFFFTY